MPDIAGKLFPNLTTLIVQLLSTGVLLLIFKKYLWKNVMEYFAKRADYIESTINEAKEMNEKASANLETAEKEAREAASKYRDILDQARDDTLLVPLTDSDYLRVKPGRPTAHLPFHQCPVR